MEFRRTRPGEVTAIDEVLRRCEEHDGRPSLSEHKYLDLAAGHLGLTGEHEGVPAAYVHVLPGPDGRAVDVETAVLPEHRSPAVYAGSVGSVLGRPGWRTAHFWAFVPEHVAALEAAGLRRFRELHELTAPLPMAEAPVFGGDITVRGFRPGRDEGRWLAANAAAFAHHPEAGMWTASWLEARMRRPWFDAPGFLLAWSGDAIAAYCWTKVHPDRTGEIFLIGVHPAYRGRGLGRAMSLAGLAHLAGERDCSTAILFADAANTAGMAMYRSMGFAVDRTDLVYAT